MNKYISILLDFSRKHWIKIASAAGAVIAACILINILPHLGTNRRVFIYPLSGSSKTQKEVRYLGKNPVQGDVQYYIDELILGPSFYRGRPLFTLGTTVEYCFLREKTLYVGLSEKASLQTDGALLIEEGVKLFKKNIKKNFTGIKNIELFIDGNFIAD